jgi:hypothetical protein
MASITGYPTMDLPSLIPVKPFFSHFAPYSSFSFSSTGSITQARRANALPTRYTSYRFANAHPKKSPPFSRGVGGIDFYL